MKTKPCYDTDLLSAVRIGATTMTLVAFATGSTMSHAAPGGVSGASMWLDARFQATPSQWVDRSGNNNHANQPFPADQPEITLGHNFHPTVRFTQSQISSQPIETGLQGAYVHYDINTITPSDFTPESSIFIVGRRTHQYETFLELGNNVNRGFTGLIASPHYELFDVYTENGLPNVSPAGINKLILFEATTPTTTGVDPVNTPLAIGRGTQAFRHLRGDISEIIFYKTSLDATQTQQIRSYLAVKYGISLEQQNTQN
ncbi:hypothetical protein H4F17_17070, partial [Vibrio cholerae]